MTNDINAAHKQKMIRLNETFEKQQAEATHEKGLLIVHSGAGKGKTTAGWRSDDDEH